MIDRAATKAVVTRKLNSILRSAKERYTDWRISVVNDRISRKETELDFLRVKGAAMEAKAGMMHSRDAAEYEEKANELIDFYEGEIICGLSVNHVPVAIRLLSIMVLILAEVALWIGLLLLLAEVALWIGLLLLLPAVELPGAVVAILAYAALLAIAAICNIAAHWLARRQSDAYLRLRIKKIRRYLATIGRNEKK